MATAWTSQPPAPIRLRGWRDPKQLIFAGAVAATLLGAIGFTSHELFHQQSTLKYAITVLGPAFVAGLTLTREPLRLLICLAIFVTPIDFVATINGIQVTPLVAVLVVAGPLMVLQQRRAEAGWLRAAAIAAPLLLLPAVVFSSAPNSYAVWVLETLAVGWLAFRLASEEGGLRLVLEMVTLSAFLQSLIAIYEYKTGHTLNLYTSSGTQAVQQNYFFNYGHATRPSGTTPDPISLGNILALSLPLMVSCAVTERDWRIRIGTMVASAVTALAVILTYSRMSWIGAGVGVPLCVLLLPRGTRARTTVAVAGVGVVIVALGLSIGGSQLQQRLSSVLNPTDQQSHYIGTAKGDILRQELWGAAFKVAKEKPATGTGFGKLLPALNQNGVSVGVGSHAQNFYLEILAEAGVLGGLALVILIVCLGRDLLAAFWRHRVFVAGATGATVAMLLGWSTDITPRYVQVSGMIATMFGAVSAKAGEARWRRDEDDVIEGRLSSPPEPPPRRRRRALEWDEQSNGNGGNQPTLIVADDEGDVALALDRLQIPFLLRPVDKDEIDGNEDHNLRHAALRRALAAASPGAREAVLGVVTRVMLGSEVFAPPLDEEEARDTLETLSGTTHYVLSAVALVWAGGVRVAGTATAVTLRALSPELIDWYVSTGEWIGRSGAYDIEGEGASLVQRIEGDYQNVVGLPLEALLEVYPSILERPEEEPLDENTDDQEPKPGPEDGADDLVEDHERDEDEAWERLAHEAWDEPEDDAEESQDGTSESQDGTSDSMVRRVADSALNLMGRFGLLTAISAVSTIAITRAFGPVRYGPYASAVATWALLGAAADFGFSLMLSRDSGHEGRPSRAMYRIAYQSTFTWCSFLALVEVGLAISAGLDTTRGQILLVLTPAMVFNGLNPARSAFMVTYETHRLLIIDVVTTVVQVGTIVVLLAAGSGPLVIAGVLSVSSILNGLLVLRAAERLLDPDGPRYDRRELIRRAAPLGLMTVITQAYFSIDLVLLGWLAHGSRLGEYAAAAKLLTLLTTTQGVVVTSALPAMSREAAQGRDVKPLFNRIWLWLAVGVLPLFVIVAAGAPVVIDVFFGHRYHGAVPLLRILCLAGIVSVFSNIGGYLQIALRLMPAIYRQNCAALILNVAGNVILVPTLGVVAAAWMTLASELLIAISALYSIRHDVDLRHAARLGLRPVLALACAAVIGVALSTEPLIAAILAAAAFLICITALRAWPDEFTAVGVSLRRRVRGAVAR